MRVLIIGGTGSISTYVAEELARKGHEITITSRRNAPVPHGYSCIRADRDDPEGFINALQKWEGDVSLDFICYHPEHARVVHEALKGRVRQHLFVSTAAVYDKSSPGCIPLTDDAPHGAEHWEYARLKQTESYFMQALGDGFPVTIVRPSHTLGFNKIPAQFGGPRFTVARRMLDQKPVVLAGDGQTLWTLTASWDFAVGMAGLVGNDKAIGEAFHITSDQVLTWNNIYWEIGRALGVEPIIKYRSIDEICSLDPSQTGNLRDDKGVHTIFDNSKIKRVVPSFACHTTFRDYMEQTIAWYQEDESRMAVDAHADAVIEKLL